MIALLRQGALLAIAAAASWWLFLAAPEPRWPEIPWPLAPREAPPAVSLTSALEEPPRAEPAEIEPAPPPPELGTPEGADEEGALPAAEPSELQELEPESEPPEPEPEPEPEPAPELEPEPEPQEAAAEPEPQPEPEPARAPAESLMQDPALVAAAEREFDQPERRGFATVLLSAPEDQLDIAAFFGEELVLVPREAIRPGAPEPSYHRIAPGARAVETVRGAPPLERYRQYRDLFDYEYARLPAPLRELRRQHYSREELFLFAALVPAREWALVIGRREEALARAGRSIDEVRRFVLRYVRRPRGGFDLEVEEILFQDGTRHVPDPLRR